MTKQCKLCGEVKPLTQFYPLAKSRRHLGDGYDTRCKDCVKAYMHSDEAKQQQREASRKRYQTEDGREKCRQKQKRHRATPQGKAAHAARQKRYRATENGRQSAILSCKKYRLTEAFAVSVAKYRKQNPEKRAAGIILMNALKIGRIARASQCESCGKETRLEGHHPDYAFPLQVVWLCKRCHELVHHP